MLVNKCVGETVKNFAQTKHRVVYTSSWIDVKVNIDLGGYFYGKTKETITGTQRVHQQPHIKQ